MTIDELKATFAGIELPVEAELYPGVIVRDVQKFIDSHLATIKNANNARMADVFADRLVRLLEIVNERNEAVSYYFYGFVRVSGLILFTFALTNVI